MVFEICCCALDYLEAGTDDWHSASGQITLTSGLLLVMFAKVMIASGCARPTILDMVDSSVRLWLHSAQE